MASGKNRGKNKKKYTVEEIKNMISGYLTFQNNSAAVRLAFDHYIFMEISHDGINPYIESAGADIDELEDIIDAVYVKGTFSPAQLRPRITGLRNRLIHLTGILAQYADRFSLFEYVFNRLEYKFIEHEKLDTDEIIRKAVGYIFESDDSMIINTRILSVIGQLPVRMTRGRLTDLVKDGCMVYNGSDRLSFDMFLMNLSDCAGISEIDQSVPEFDNFRDELADFEKINFREMDKAGFEEYRKRLEAVTENLQDLNDVYSHLTSMANALYINILCSPFAQPVPADSPEVIVIRGTYSLLRGTENSVWNEHAHPASDDFEDRIESLDRFLEMTEGKQEGNAGRAEILYSTVEKICETRKEDVTSVFGGNIIGLIDTVTKLSGSSMYMEIEEPDEEVPGAEGSHEKDYEEGNETSALRHTSAVVSINRNEKNDEEENGVLNADRNYINEKTAEFNLKLQERLSSVDRPVRRAVMAAVIERLPIFFKQSSEVIDYITDSLKYCDNESERQASLNAVNMAAGQ